MRRLLRGTLERRRQRRQTAAVNWPLARWSSSLGHWPPSHHLLFSISSLLFSCSWRMASVISSLNGEPGKWQESRMKASGVGRTRCRKEKKTHTHKRSAWGELEKNIRRRTSRWKKGWRRENCSCSLEMATSDRTVRIKRGLVRDKEWDYTQTEAVLQLLLGLHTKHAVN